MVQQYLPQESSLFSCSGKRLSYFLIVHFPHDIGESEMACAMETPNAWRASVKGWALIFSISLLLTIKNKHLGGGLLQFSRLVWVKLGCFYGQDSRLFLRRPKFNLLLCHRFPCKPWQSHLHMLMWANSNILLPTELHETNHWKSL